MEKIKSFCINHDTLKEGIYISRIDNDITTFDLRFIKPNTPPFLDQKSLHTIEHLFATYARNSSFSDNVIYFGPMGCRTGFYFLTRGLDNKSALRLIKDTLIRCKNHTGEIPGSLKKECGNYKEHDLEKALIDINTYYEKIKLLTEDDLFYEEI